MLKERPLILVINDDGIHAPGLQALKEAVKPLGRLVVVAPDQPRSGTSHAVTMHTPLRLTRINRENDIEEYSCNGTPVDCVKLAYKIVLNGKPDILVSGINHGSNASINIIYSGTMAAVLEGAMAGVPSIGFSLASFESSASMSTARHYAEIITKQVISHGLPDGICLNVNIPHLPKAEIRGVKVCRQAGGTWIEDFDIRQDPQGIDYYWLKGIFARIGNGEDTDEHALENGYVSVVPVNFDFTDYKAFGMLRDWDFSG